MYVFFLAYERSLIRPPFHSSYEPVIHSIVSTRILLHVRRVAAQNGVLTREFELDIRTQDSSELSHRATS